MIPAPDREPDLDDRPQVGPESDPGESVLIQVGGTPFLFPRKIEPRVAEVMRGKYDFGNLPDLPSARRIIDIRACVADFACWAWRRWRNAWVECYEPDPALHPFLKHNLPPGGAIHPIDVKDSAGAAILPPCDVLRLDAGGGEADILRGYRYRPNVVCFDWHRDQDRLEIETTLSSWGLRCFKLAFKHPDLGHEVWVRSQAVWSMEKKAYVLP